MKTAQIEYSEVNVDLFWSRVKTQSKSQCWLWTGSKDKDGYGYFTVGSSTRKAHRVAYLLANKSLPQGLCICHSCDTPACCNPRHLWAGSNKENCVDAVRKGRTLTGTRNRKAKLTESRVRKILALRKQNLTYSQIAKIVPCSDSTVMQIVNGKQWQSVTHLRRVTPGLRRGLNHPRHILTPKIVFQIRSMHAKGGIKSEIALALGLNYHTVYSVLSGQTWSHLENPA